MIFFIYSYFENTVSYLADNVRCRMEIKPEMCREVLPEVDSPAKLNHMQIELLLFKYHTPKNAMPIDIKNYTEKGKCGNICVS